MRGQVQFALALNIASAGRVRQWRSGSLPAPWHLTVHMHDLARRVTTAVACFSMAGQTTVVSPSSQAVVQASEFTLTAPGRLDAGNWQVQLRNAGLLEHHVRLLRLDEARSFREFERALVDTGAIPAWAVDIGGFASTGAGASGTTTLRLRAGLHVLICIGSLADGRAMAMKGMYRSIDVGPPAQYPHHNNH